MVAGFGTQVSATEAKKEVKKVNNWYDELHKFVSPFEFLPKNFNAERILEWDDQAVVQNEQAGKKVKSASIGAVVTEDAPVSIHNILLNLYHNIHILAVWKLLDHF